LGIARRSSSLTSIVNLRSPRRWRSRSAPHSLGRCRHVLSLRREHGARKWFVRPVQPEWRAPERLKRSIVERTLAIGASPATSSAMRDQSLIHPFCNDPLHAPTLDQSNSFLLNPNFLDRLLAGSSDHDYAPVNRIASQRAVWCVRPVVVSVRCRELERLRLSLPYQRVRGRHHPCQERMDRLADSAK
jgi:hypothetical protein